MAWLGAAAGWLLAVVLIALGGAGIVTGMDGQVGPAARPELTSGGDSQLSPLLDGAETELTTLTADVEALGTRARGALGALNGGDLDTVEAAITDGDPIVARIVARTRRLTAALAALPILDTPTAGYAVSTAVRQRAARLTSAVDATRGLDAEWARLTTGALSAARLSSLLQAQVDAVVKAASLGRDGRYREAVSLLEDADRSIADARRLRDRLVATVDVSVLDEWLDRNEAYDTALRELYVALDGVGGRVTSKVRKAIAAEQAAKAGLPGDSRGLIVIMAEIGRGGMNEAVIAIEQARGRLADAVAPG
ncbi:MAG: hypothetical protein H0U37_01395 [Chloroflexi bacterium]|nr:hypothetical protein [Chloroflexota bacterium]